MFRQEIVAFKTYDTTGQNSHAINNITINYSDSMPDSHKQVDSAVKVHRGHPSTLLELNDAFFLPGSDCLYHADGSRVTESLTRRGPDLGEIVGDTKPFARLPDHYAVVDEPLLFIARQAHHWGHFLTEGVSRLWAPIVHPALAKLKKFSLNGNANADNLHKNIVDFLHVLGIRSDDTLMHGNRPLRFKKIFVPASSFSNRGEAYTIHGEVGRSVARHYRGSGGVRSSAPVVLSRRRLKIDGWRMIENQRSLEERLSREGFVIVNPEELSLEQQIHVFCDHREFVGCWGSAFNGGIFWEEPTEATTHVISDGLPNINFLMFDAILGNRANYVKVVGRAEDDPAGPAKLSFAVDVDQFMTYWSGERNDS